MSNIHMASVKFNTIDLTRTSELLLYSYT